MNPLLLIDGYKLDHRRQYPDNTTKVYSNWTPRSSRVPDQKEVVCFGLQYFIKKYLIEDMWTHFFTRPVNDVCEEYTEMVNSYVGPNDIGSDHINELWQLGYLPLEIRALPEGTLCPIGVPMLTIENTHPKFAWLVNYIETLMSNVLWMPCTSATHAFRLRKLLDSFADKTCNNRDFVQWQGHDFSMRGMSGIESSLTSGAGHLLSFAGSDTFPTIKFVRKYYDGEGLIAGSVPATEHSVMCAGGQETELETFNRILDLYPQGIVSVVSDTWNFWDVCTKIVTELKPKIMAREGKLVLRPDSGDPVKIICGDKDATDIRARKGAVQLLWDEFGGKVNNKGYKELDPHIGLIYGDAITYDRAKVICEGLEKLGFASNNIVFGVGSYTYQYNTRDTYGFAMKATWAEVDGVGKDIFKKPVTDNGEKFSAKGRLAVLQDGNSLRLVQGATPEQEKNSLLRPVFKNRDLFNVDSFTNIRTRLGMVK
jgi:nicotinamide phosphoribosyltransferase